MESLSTLHQIADINGVSLDGQATERFAAYREMLLDWNQRVNLTRVTEPEEVERRLFGDSLILLPFIDQWERQNQVDSTNAASDSDGPGSGSRAHAVRPYGGHDLASGRRGALHAPEPMTGQGESRGDVNLNTQSSSRAATIKLVDVGAGAGFPGLALKIARPEIDLTLIEATAKKVDFMRAVIEELGLTEVTAIHGRSEELAHDNAYRQRFDVVTARAVARLATLLEYCQPLVRPGGLGLYPKGIDIDVEVAEAANALELLGARLIGLDSPPGDERTTTVIRVEQGTKIDRRYPRRAGKPAQRPL